MQRSAIETLQWGTHAPLQELCTVHRLYECEEDDHSGAGDGETPSQNVLVIGRRRHVVREVESCLSGWLLLRAVSDSMMTPKPHWVL